MIEDHKTKKRMSDLSRYGFLKPVAGLVACLFLAFWVEWKIWLTGLLLIVAGLGWHFLKRRITGNKGVTRS